MRYATIPHAMKKKTNASAAKAKKPSASHQLPVRFDPESEAALKRLMERLREPNASQIVRWAVLHYDREVKLDVDRFGVPIKPPEPQGEHERLPLPGHAATAKSASR